MGSRRDPMGVILAGGSGRRIGGSKATVKLRGRPLIAYPLAVLLDVLDEVAVIAKADTELPSLPGVTVWIEPPTPQHPLLGIIHALALAGGRPVLACAVDMPFVTASVVARIAFASPQGAPAVLASHKGALHPLLGCYQPQAGKLLNAAAAQPDIPLRDAARGIGARLLEVEDADALFNINSPDDLLQATAMLDSRLRISQT